MRRLVVTGWLLGVWLILWGSATPANVLSGLAVAAVVQLLPQPSPGRGRIVFRPLPALRFIVYFARKLVEASLVVAAEVLTPQDRIRTGIVAVPLQGASDALLTLVANAVTLTPGTLTLEVDRDQRTLYVHVLHLHSVEDVRHDIRYLEVLAVRAFGSPAALAGLGEDDSRVLPPGIRPGSEPPRP
jgi:multicomponent Na+:H+ antiporter subunit E